MLEALLGLALQVVACFINADAIGLHADVACSGQYRTARLLVVLMGMELDIALDRSQGAGGRAAL